VIASVTGFSPDKTDSTIRQRALEIGSRSELAVSHLGVGRGRFFRRESTRALLILHLRHQRDRLLAIPELHEEAATGERDRKIALPEPAHQVEGLPRRARA
jgi:hypothetical protein